MESIKELLEKRQKEINGKIQIKEKWIRAGFTIIPNALLLDDRISAQAKTIFAILCLHAFTKEEAILSYQTIELEVGLARPQVARYLKELRQAKLIQVIRTGRANKYEIDFSELNNRVNYVIKQVKRLSRRVKTI